MKIFVGFLGYEKTSLFAFEIYWPLDNCKISLIRKKIRRSDTTLQYVAHVICTVIVHSGSLNKQLTMEYKWGQKGSKNSKQQTKTAIFRDSEIIYSNLLTIQTRQILAFKISFWPETCSCPFVPYFRMLFWDDITIIWDENIVLFN